MLTIEPLKITKTIILTIFDQFWPIWGITTVFGNFLAFLTSSIEKITFCFHKNTKNCHRRLPRLNFTSAKNHRLNFITASFCCMLQCFSVAVDNTEMHDWLFFSLFTLYFFFLTHWTECANLSKKTMTLLVNSLPAWRPYRNQTNSERIIVNYVNYRCQRMWLKFAGILAECYIFFYAETFTLALEDSNSKKVTKLMKAIPKQDAYHLIFLSCTKMCNFHFIETLWINVWMMNLSLKKFVFFLLSELTILGRFI